MGCGETAQHPAGQSQPGSMGLPRDPSNPGASASLCASAAPSAHLGFTAGSQRAPPHPRKCPLPAAFPWQSHSRSTDRSQTRPLSHTPAPERNWKASDRWMHLAIEGSQHPEPRQTKPWCPECSAPHCPRPVTAPGYSFLKLLKLMPRQLQKPFKKDRLNPRWT